MLGIAQLQLFYWNDFLLFSALCIFTFWNGHMNAPPWVLQN